MREVIILQRRIAALEQYNQYLLERNEALEGLLKKYKKFLEELQKGLRGEEYEKIH